MQTVMARGRVIPVENKRRAFYPRRPATATDHAVAAVVANSNIENIEPNSIRGGAVDFIREGDITISAAQAAILTSSCVHPIQKDIRPLDHKSASEHISVLSALMQTPGAWMDETQIRFGILDGRLWIMDGNHRIRAQAESGADITWNIKVDRYSSESEFRAAFHKFNTNSRTRTQAQILGATGFASDFGITRQTATALFNAMPFIISGFKTGKSHMDVLKSRVVDTRLDMAAKFGKEAASLDACLKGADSRVKRRILNAGVTAVALVTLRHRPDKAIEFWNGVAKNDGLKKGDPRHTLVMDLMTRNMSQGAAHQSIASPAAAWNAWYEGRSLSIIKVLDVDGVRIAGTPYKG